MSSASHPINPTVERWVEESSNIHYCEIIRDPQVCSGGDICFLVSCTSVVPSSIIERYKKVLVIHASDLPKGRGWSPHVYGLLNGDDELCISLIEADAPVDTGVIWTQIRRALLPFYTLNDVMEILSEAHLELFNFAIERFESVQPLPQCSEIEPTYFKRRTPADSELDINKTISEQFNLMRAADPNRFPAFFYMYGKKFTLKLERVDDE